MALKLLKVTVMELKTLPYLLKILVLVLEEMKILFGDLYITSMCLIKVIGNGNLELISEEVGDYL